MIGRSTAAAVGLLLAACRSGGGAPDAAVVFTDPKIAELARAVAEGDRERVHGLVRAGADPDARGDKDVNLLQWALLNRSRAGLDALLEVGADPSLPGAAGETVVHYAAKANDPSYLDILLKRNADPDAPHRVTLATPLMAAMMANREVQFHKLLAAGADPMKADRMGNTPLHVAAKINAYRRAMELLKAGADPMARNNQGATFRRYLEATPADVMTDSARRQREEVLQWVEQNGGGEE